MPDLEYEEMTRIAVSIANGKMGIDLLHCIEEDKFYTYKTNVWQHIFEVEIAKIMIEHPNYKYIVKHALSKRDQIIKNLKTLVQIRIDQFNKLGYLNFDCGEFDPMYKKPFSDPSGAWHEHKKENLSTLRMPYETTVGLDCPLWKKTILEIFEGDQDKVNTLQEFFGYCLTRDTRKEKALLLLGESRTGKSTILETLSYMVGQENSSFVSLDYIFHPQYSPLLMNKLVNIDTDVSSKAENYEREFKTITSGEPITCNQKFVETFKFRPYCKLVMAANVFPKIQDHSSAFYKRLILLPCNRIFEENEQDIHLKDKLLEELYSIFEWSCEGLERLNNRGAFERKDFMVEAIQELEDENNPSNVFFNEHIEIEIGDHIYLEKGELYEKYKKWCEETKNYTLSKSRFSNTVYKKYSKFTPKTTSLVTTGKRIWRNLKWVENKETSSVVENAQKIIWEE